MLKRHMPFAAIALAVALFCALKSPPSVLAGPDNPEFSDSDKKFVVAVAHGGMAEVKLGQLATEKGTSDDVKKFGQKMIDDHSKANDELKNLALSKNITLPGDGDLGKHQKTYDKLAKLSGADFDKAYVKAMLDDHIDDVKDFQKQAERGQDTDLKTWAAKTLPTLQMHLSMISDMDKAMGGKGASDKDMGMK